MNDETTRRSFFSVAACSPLALLGLMKTSYKPNLDVNWESAARFNRVFCDHWMKVAEQQAKELKELRERVEAAEKDAVESREMRDNWEKIVNYRSKHNDYWCERALAAEKKLKETA